MIGSAIHRRKFRAALIGAVAEMGASRARPRSARRALELLIHDYVDSKRLTGAAVAISEGNGSTTWLNAGHIAVNSEKPFDRDSICRVYSMTKPVTGLAAMLLIEDGLLKLD